MYSQRCSHPIRKKGKFGDNIEIFLCWMSRYSVLWVTLIFFKELLCWIIHHCSVVHWPGKNSLRRRSHYFILRASNSDTRLQRRRNVTCKSNHSRLLYSGYVHAMRCLFRRRAELLAAHFPLWSHRILIRKAAHFYVKLSGK